MNDITEGLHDAIYLGDGCYVGTDGYQIWLRTQRENCIHEIALEPGVFQRLIAWHDALMQKHVEASKDVGY